MTQKKLNKISYLNKGLMHFYEIYWVAQIDSIAMEGLPDLLYKKKNKYFRRHIQIT